MTGGRPRTPIGAHGEISYRSSGTGVCAYTRFRDLDGRLRLVQATAGSRRAAGGLLKERLLTRPGHGSGGVLRPASSFGDTYYRRDRCDDRRSASCEPPPNPTRDS